MIDVSARRAEIDQGIWQRALPFALFMAFIALDEALQLAARWHWLSVPQTVTYYLYPVKTVAVAGLLLKYRGIYQELRLRDLAQAKTTLAVVLIGLLTCVLWVSCDATLALAGAPRGFNPTLLPEGPVRLLMTATRVAGAVLVVPLMEELFWRSFLLRYLVDADFDSVPLGRFTWSSFLITTVLFGLEHHLVLAGMAAGAIYNVILYRTRSLAQCVLAHAVTNLALACYVLYTAKWYFW